MEDLLHANRQVLKDVMRAAGRELATEHELSVKLLKGSFTRGTFTIPIRFGVPAIEAEMHNEFLVTWLPRVGLPDDIIGRTYTNEDGLRYTVVDLSERLDVKCVRVVIEGTEAPRYKVSPRKVREALGIPEPDGGSEEAADDDEIDD